VHLGLNHTKLLTIRHAAAPVIFQRSSKVRGGLVSISVPRVPISPLKVRFRSIGDVLSSMRHLLFVILYHFGFFYRGAPLGAPGFCFLSWGPVLFFFWTKPAQKRP
jgi:hypothetical protein